MFNIQVIRVPFLSAVNTFGLSDGATFSVSFSGIYQPLPYGNDNFDSYITGGGQFTQLFFSGSGNWNGSGYTANKTIMIFDNFDSYQEGTLFSFKSGLYWSGYFTGLATGKTSYDSIETNTYLQDNFENYPTGNIIYLDSGTNINDSVSYFVTGEFLNGFYI